MVERRTKRAAGAALLQAAGDADVERLETEWVGVDAVRPHPRNYRSHPDDQIAHLKASIEEHGFYRAIVTARDGTVLAGHGLFLAAKALGRDRVPIFRQDLDPNEASALKILVGDNEIAHGAAIDDRTLTDILKEMHAAGGAAALLGTGYNPQTLGALLFVTRPPDLLLGKNETDHWVGMPEFTPDDPRPRLLVTFESEADRAEFMKKIGVTVTDLNKKVGVAWSMWWPLKKNVEVLRSTMQLEG